jgi:sulfate transport system substrate-binding protein
MIRSDDKETNPMKSMPLNSMPLKYVLFTLALGLALVGPASAKDVELLNVSYDPTRELYQDVNQAFAAQWKQQTGQTLTVRASHGGSGKQARSVIDGLEADVVTLALAADIDAIATNGKMLPANWQGRLPHNSAPYTSTIVFLVRKGNPKGIKDWDDLAKPGVAVITPNPKTSGGARWNYLAAWAWASQQYRDGGKVLDYMGRLFKNVPVLDTGARGATTTFVERGIGDVLVAWENEALLTLDDADTRSKFQIVVPSISIRAEPPVAWVDKNVARHGTQKIAEAYLRFLYTPQGQQIVAKHFYRPAEPDKVPAAAMARFPEVKQVTIDGAFGGWKKAQAEHFADGGFFDQIYQPGR